MSVRLQGPDGQVVEVEPEQVSGLIDRQYKVLSNDERAGQVADAAREEFYSTPGQQISAGIAGAARGATFGLSDALGRAMGAEEELSALREYNPGVSLATEIGGSLLTAKAPAGLATKAVGTAAEGASVLSRVGRAGAVGTIEGTAQGIGSGISEVSLSKEPLTLERAVSSIGSHALFGGAVGGGAVALLKAGGIGLRAAQSKLDDVAANAAKGGGKVDEVAGKAFVDEAATFRKASIKDELFGVVKGSADRETRSMAKIWLEADKAIDRTLRNPKALAAKPDRILSALQQQEHAIEQVAAKADDMRAALRADVDTFAMSSEGKIAAAKLEKLDKIPAALEQNRALQAKIQALTVKPAESGGGGLARNLLGGTAFGVVAGAVGSVLGPTAGSLAGAFASNLVTEGLGKMAAKQAARASKAIGTFLDVTAKVPNVVPVLASKVLASVKFSEGKMAKVKEPKKGRAAPKIAAAYARVADDIKAQTMFGPDGKTMMRPEARQKMAASFDAVRMVDPVAADRMETMGALRITAISDRMPRRPDVMGLAVGPIKWQPSDMEMRAHARFIAAVEDPIGVVERLATGQITMEDRDAMKEVYPEMYADIQAQIMSQLPSLQKQLPYQRRLALSIFSGVPVDPSLDPAILSVLQSQYSEEPGTEGGTQAPTPEPQFGSVKAVDSPTKAQAREAQQGATT